jgi:hypothetical protein
MPPPPTLPKPSSVPTIDASPRPADVRAYQKLHSDEPSGTSLGALDSFASGIAGMGKAPSPSRDSSSGPRYSEPPRTSEEAMNEGSTDVHPSTPEPNPLTPQHNAPPAPDDEEPAAPAAKGRDDDRMGETSEDILDSISELAGSRKDKEEASEEPAASTDDAELDKEIAALGPLPKVRAAHREQIKKNKELQATLESKTRELTEISEKLKSNANLGDLAKELESAREKAAEYEKRLQIVDYTKSDEFQRSHVEPLEKAIGDAFETVKELTIDEYGERRTATEADFRKILSMDPASAREAADEMFGKWGHEVLDHYKSVRKLDKQRHEALANADTRAGEARQRAQAQQQLEQVKIKETYTSAMKELGDKYSDLFGDREGDDEVNTLVAKQRQYVQQLVDATDMPLEDRVRASAKIHQQAINYPKVIVDLKRAREELAALKKQMKSFESSEPREGSRSSAADLDGEDDPLKQLDMIASRRGR